MSDTENKVMKSGELGESFSDLMKKVVEKQLEEENANLETKAQESTPTEALATEEKETLIIKSEAAAAPKPAEVPVFDWKPEEKPVIENYQPVSEVGIISPMTTINGTVSSKGHIRVEGNVIGDVFAYGDVKVTGKIAGDVEGGNIELGGCIVDGDVKARGDVTVGRDSTLSGNMSGQLITIDGKIKGNIEALKGAHMSSTSLVKGSIIAPTLSMSAGAELQGKVSVAKDELE
jgi:Integral membrane protein CcmA involved in cell shape determination